MAATEVVRRAEAPARDWSTRLALVWDWARDLPLLLQDAALYGGSCGFALLTAAFAVSADYRAWGQMAAIAYGVAAVVCLIGYRRTTAQGAEGVSAARHLRRFVLVALVAAVVLVPLGAEVAWRAEATGGAHAQPEVAVIERAGDRAATGGSPYLTHPHDVGVSPVSDAKSVDDASFFPYLPGMVLFGLPSAYSAIVALGDARLALVLVTLVVTAAALYLSRDTLRLRARVLQILVVLPFGALPMATGGDDLPVLAITLLGLVLAARRRPVVAGLALGVGATLKFTAWPILILLAFVVRDAEGRRAFFRYGLACAAVAVPVILVGALTSPSGFIENVVRFPLGLAHVNSPAASPLVGQVLTNVFKHDRRIITALLGLVGVAIVAGVIVRRPPRTVAAVAGVTAFALLLATLLAPATRFGYLIYPANFAAWALALSAGPRVDQSASSRSKMVSEMVLAPAGVAPPFSAGASEGLAPLMTTPTSQ